MARMNYKIGDMIKMTKEQRERFKVIESKVDGAKLAIAFLAEAYGTYVKQAWSFIEREYPEMYKKYELSFNNGRIRINMPKIGGSDE